MKYGISIPVRGDGANPAAFDGVAAKADAAGLDVLWASDHLLMAPPNKSKYPGTPDGSLPPPWKRTYFQPFSVLNYLAGRTRNVRLGTSVLILPMRNPIEVAAQIAELDQVSRGRVNFGVGVGWFEDEYDALGYPFKKRGKRANDGLKICKKLWTGEPAAHESEFYSFSGAVLGPTPVQKPHPPIYIGGHSPGALKRVAKFGDVWHPFRVGPDEFADLRPKLAEALKAEDRSIDDIPMCPKIPLVVQDEAGPLPTMGHLAGILDALKKYQDNGATEFCFDIVPETEENAVAMIDLILSEIKPKLG
ncbi:MAG: LLM class F420-dependent oxidoreductase [Minwuia sp.]|uniref:LLM class F420-dependent oxidoreductase n=1 Tax=Minwuia sp. TaxID=2493630 RepID=UPI003A8580E3